MEFLDQIVTSIQNDPAPVIAVALAALIGVVGGSIMLGLWRLFFRTIPHAIRYKSWPFCCGLFIKAQIEYRRWRAKQVMAAYLSGVTLSVPLERYEHVLRGNPLTSAASELEAIRPPQPRWLNDYYVATALENLSRDRKIVKARQYHASVWPPKTVNYRFRLPTTDRTPAEEAHEFETDGKCKAYQSFNECPVGQRFDVQVIRETVSIREKQTRASFPLKDSAPPCERCWEKAARAQAIEPLVDSITGHDLSDDATIEITGENQEFQKAAIAVCCEGQWEPGIPIIKDIVARAIEIRREQLDSLGLGESTEWTEQLTADFSNALSAYIRDELE